MALELHHLEEDGGTQIPQRLLAMSAYQNRLQPSSLHRHWTHE
jgi:hypothetical protein